MPAFLLPLIYHKDHPVLVLYIRIARHLMEQKLGKRMNRKNGSGENGM